MKSNQVFGPGAFPACVVAAVLSAGAFQPALLGGESPPKVPLVLKLPEPTLQGTPEDLPKGPNIEPLPTRPRPPFLVPKGVQNVALNKPVTGSVAPFTGDFKQITDGKKEPIDSDAVEMKRGTQWVQVDLGRPYAIYAIVVWHDHRYIQVTHDVIVQVSDDPTFKTGVQTLFNNDTDNSSGVGMGTDREYFETNQGKLIDAKGVKARYLRGYSRGTSSSALNCWEEIEVYALPNAGQPGGG
jgi:NedA-like, galactose-binding domain